MTIREWAEHYLYDRGMSSDQASSAIDELVAGPFGELMANRWGDSVDRYPGGVSKLGVVLAIPLDDAAVKWIDKNCPKAWFRPSFAGRNGL